MQQARNLGSAFMMHDPSTPKRVKVPEFKTINTNNNNELSKKREVTNKRQQKPQKIQNPLNSYKNEQRSRQHEIKKSQEAPKGLGRANGGRLPESGKSSTSGGNSQLAKTQAAHNEETPIKVPKSRKRKRTRKKKQTSQSNQQQLSNR